MTLIPMVCAGGVRSKANASATCGRGRHPVPQSAPIPLAARAALSFGLWGDKPPDADALRTRLDSHLARMRLPERREESPTDAAKDDHATDRGSVRRLAAR